MPFIGSKITVPVSAEDSNKMSGAICDVLEKELGIPGDKVYVEYRGTHTWGWNGSNF